MAILNIPQTILIPDDDFEKRLSIHLIESGLVKEMDLARARRLRQDQADGTLVYLLVRLGMISERSMAEAQAEVAGVDLVKPQAYPDDPVLADQLSVRFLRDQSAIPLTVTEDSVCLAVADLSSTYITRAAAMATGLTVHRVVGLNSEIQTALEQAYDEDVDKVDQTSNESEEFSEYDVAKLRDMASEAPVIRLVNQMIQRAVDARASDIHVEPYENVLKIRTRVDGVLRDEPSPPRDLGPAVISRIKIMADLDIAERRLPQDGRINVRIQGQEMDVRVSTVPTIYGESVVMRLLQRESVTLDFDSLGFSERLRKVMKTSLEMPYGMIIVTGPTGSGKTTTLYTALNSLNTETRKVITVEDPVEYNLEGINQIQVNSNIGLSFANALRSIVRQDPDVIMVGEMRDLETAKICVQSALTGHLVLSTLHTNDAAGSVTRLLEMGIDDYLLNSTLNIVLAQRLVRRLCEECKAPYVANEGQIREFRLDKLVAGDPDCSELNLHRSVGCESCGGTGYRGRMSIVEVLEVSDGIRALILEHASAADIERKAQEEGMRTMYEDASLKAAQGFTTLDEVVRVTQEV